MDLTITKRTWIAKRSDVFHGITQKRTIRGATRILVAEIKTPASYAGPDTTPNNLYQWQIAFSIKRHFTGKWQMILWGIKRQMNEKSFVCRKQHMFLFPHQEGNTSCVPFPFYEFRCLPLVEMGKRCEIKIPVLCYCFSSCFSILMSLKLFFYVRIFQFFIRRHIIKI
jgi:hypothetical protein